MGFKLVHGSSAVPFVVEKEAFEGVRLIAERFVRTYSWYLDACRR